MRLVCFFVLSLLLHIAALAYPGPFSGRSQVEMIQVQILPMEQEGGGDQGEGAIPARRRDSKVSRPTPPAVEPRVEPKSLANPVPQGLPADTEATVHNSVIERVSAAASASATAGVTIADTTGNDVNGYVSSLDGTGNGSGSSGTELGRGNTNGTGSGSSRTGLVLTQARYRHAPRPDYPDSARREGREGRVLLRVLVDDQGRSKQVEINSSSGNDTLDRAAAEAIKRWRFHPARQGDQPIESWLRIPIEFRLANAKSQ